ncbi:ABC-2 type transporter [compost metagenome]
MLAALGMAMAIAGLAGNNENGGAFNTLIITPTCMIGGCFWPFQIMPDYMQKLANFVPQKWAIEAISILSTGGRLADVGLHLAILTLFGLVLLSFGTTALLPDSARTD